MIDTEVWLPLVTLVVGYAGSLVTESFRDKRAARREAQARQADRQQKRADRQADFQRETLLALQESLGRYVRGAAQVHHETATASRAAGRWTRVLPAEDVNDALFRAGIDMNTYVVRTLDDQLRETVYALRERVGRLLITAASEAEADQLMDEATDLFTQANERIGELLRTVY